MNRRWTKEEAWKWWNEHEWIMGLNYVPSCMPGTSIWQEDTIEEALETVIPEMDLIKETGFNAVRMFLPSSIWVHEREVFWDRLDRIFALLYERGIKVMPVLGNDCVKFGRPDDITIRKPVGKQEFDWGHHGGHADSPFTGEKVRRGWVYWDEEEYLPLCEEYLHSIFERFGKDERIIMWDMWNEPGNSNRRSMSIPFLQRSFEIARMHDPIAPLTAGVWTYPENYGVDTAAELMEIQRLSIDLSDIVTFHEYENFDRVKTVVSMLEKEGRPMANTEWLHRIFDNFIQDNLPLYFEKKIGSFHWGLVAGHSQHYLPWDEIKGRPGLDYSRWQHDIYREDHTPYDPAEIAMFKEYGAKKDQAGK